jgi:hypothetical protein
MQTIIVHLKNNKTETFEHQVRPGGSYSLQLRYEGEFAIVVDEWGKETVFPAANIEKIETVPSYSGW